MKYFDVVWTRTPSRNQQKPSGQPELADDQNAIVFNKEFIWNGTPFRNSNKPFGRPELWNDQISVESIQNQYFFLLFLFPRSILLQQLSKKYILVETRSKSISFSCFFLSSNSHRFKLFFKHLLYFHFWIDNWFYFRLFS